VTAAKKRLTQNKSCDLSFQLNDEEDRPDRQYINELQELLESLDTVDCAEISDKAYQKKSYDLCEECCQEYLKNPLAIEQVAPMGYSNN